MAITNYASTAWKPVDGLDLVALLDFSIRGEVGADGLCDYRWYWFLALWKHFCLGFLLPGMQCKHWCLLMFMYGNGWDGKTFSATINIRLHGEFRRFRTAMLFCQSFWAIGFQRIISYLEGHKACVNQTHNSYWAKIYAAVIWPYITLCNLI